MKHFSLLPNALYNGYLDSIGLFHGCQGTVRTVARGRKPRATVPNIFPDTEDNSSNCFRNSHEITVLLPNENSCQSTVQTVQITII